MTWRINPFSGEIYEDSGGIAVESDPVHVAWLATVRSANAVFAGPTTGAAAAPTWRALVAGDIPAALTNVPGGTVAGQVLTTGATPFAAAWSGFSLAGTAAQTYAFPSAGGTVALLNAANLFTARQSVVVAFSSDPGSDQDVAYFQNLITVAAARNFYASTSYMTASHASGTVSSITGNRFQAYHTGAGTTTSIYGVEGTVYVGGGAQTDIMAYKGGLAVYGGTPTINRATGFYFRHTIAGATVSTGFGTWIANPSKTTGTMNTLYAHYVEALTAGGTNYAFYSAGAGLVHFGDSLDLASGKNITMLAGNIVTDTTTGTKIGTATTQKLGFWNAAPIVQPAETTQAAPAAYTTGAFGLDSDAHMQALYDLVVAMRTALVNTGLMKGAA